MNIIDFIFIFFVVLTMFFGFLFMVIFFKNRKDFVKVPIIKKWPFVSLIVPAYNEEKTIVSVLENLKKLEYPGKFEIIVVNDGSTDRTGELAKKCSVKAIDKEQTKNANSKSCAVNLGIKYAKGEIFACIDADSYPEKDALLKSVPFFVDSNVGAVTSRIFVKDRERFFEKLQAIEYAIIAWSRKLLEYIDAVYVTPGPLSLYRKSLVVKLGGFDKDNATEDIEIAWRILNAGYKIKMTPATTYTTVPITLKKWWKQRLRWNVGGIQTSLKYKSAMFRGKNKAFSQFILPFFMLSYLLSMLALSLFVYLIYMWIFTNVSFAVSAVSVGLNPIKTFSPMFMPDIFTVYGIAILILSAVIVNCGLKDTGHSRSFKNWLHILVYLSIYITIFPFILVHSFIKYMKNYKEW